MRLLVCAICIALRGRRRDLNRYYYFFYLYIDSVVTGSLQECKNFICYNDQKYDAAAIICSLRLRNQCRTVVLQHGLIVNSSYYFPTISNEFWAWGQLSQTDFRAAFKDGRLRITGRKTDDKSIKEENFARVKGGRKRILIAFSPSYRQLVNGLRAIRALQTNGESIQFFIKYHPATKLKFIAYAVSKTVLTCLRVEKRHVENITEEYDALLTCNSTCAVDFLLNGRPVFSLDKRSLADVPRLQSCVVPAHRLFRGGNAAFYRQFEELNEVRIGMLKEVLNV